MNLKVFVSHASEDKDRFVRCFATRLRAKGIEAWVDEWEIMPGDSLVDKIFEEGIGEAQAMVVVLSEYSVKKRWVREELNAGVVRRINNASKLIPVVIGDVDESQMPESLKSVVWERVRDLDNYDAELERVVRAIYERREKPPLGSAPAYTQTAIDAVPGLTELDSWILKLCCEAQLQEGSIRAIFGPQVIFEQTEEKGLPEEEVLETFEVLENRRYLKLNTSSEGYVLALRVTDYGFSEYARVYIPDYDSVFRSVALQLVNHDRNNSRDIVEVLDRPAVLIEHVLNVLANRGHIGAQTFDGGLMFIYKVSPELKRLLRET